VAFVAIGATMVGSITFLKKEGDYVHKGDEVSFVLFPSCNYSTACSGLFSYLICPLLS
jgi:phosphatidylserine decarboxylase